MVVDQALMAIPMAAGLMAMAVVPKMADLALMTVPMAADLAAVAAAVPIDCSFFYLCYICNKSKIKKLFTILLKHKICIIH
jgi:hypothetical protein